MEEEKRIEYCKKHDIHHLFELLATKVLVDRPENPFKYLQDLLVSIEDSEKKKGSYDPTNIAFDSGTYTIPLEREEALKAHNQLSKLYKITLGTFGLNNAGKTTLLSAMGGNIDKDCTPTVGFSPLRFQTDAHDICIFDLGGAANFRGIWVHYFHDCHGIVFVIDSAADKNVIAESLGVFKQTVQHPYMKGKPVLLLVNKKDLPSSHPEEVVPDGFIAEVLPPGTPYLEVATCGIIEDESLDKGLEWILNAVSERYEDLQTRVEKDTAKVREEKEKKRVERLAALRAET